MFATIVRHERRLWAVLLCGLLTLLPSVAMTVEDDDINANNAGLRRLVEALGGDAYALDVGRISYRPRWEKLLNEALYQMAPRGTWDEKGPAWAAARKALSDTLRRESARLHPTRVKNDRRRVNQDTVRTLSADEMSQAVAFFESPVGRVFVAARTRSAHAEAYGMPPGIESETEAQVKAAGEKALAALDAIPEDHGDGKLMVQFLDGPVWKKILNLQLYDWADSTSYSINWDMEDLLRAHLQEYAAALRKAVPGMPAASDKTYLGHVEMGVDRSFTVTVEHYIERTQMGKYTLKYAPADLHWHDIAAMVPGIKPGESRFIYFDPRGMTGDKP